MALVERLAVLIEANAGKAIAEFKKVGAAAKAVEGDATAGAQGLGRLGTSGAVAGNLMKAALVTGVAAAGAAITKFTVDGVNSFITLAGEVRRFQNIAGGTTESASQLVAGFKAVGIDADTAGTAIFQLEKRLTTNKAKLAEFGVVVAKDARGNTDMAGTLLSVGDAFKRTHDPAERATLLAASFGKQGTALIPLLSKSREEIQAFFADAEKHHAILTPEDLAKAKEYKLAMHDLGEAFKGLEMAAAKGLVPTLTKVADVITKAIEGIDKLQSTPLGAGSLGGFFDSIIHGSDKVATKAAPALGLAFGAIGDAIASVTKNAAADAADVDTLTKSLFSLESASRAVDAAVRDVDAANRDHAEKEAVLNKLLKEKAVDQKAVAAATREHDAAERELAKAEREHATATTAASNAERTLADLRSGAAAAKNRVDHADDVGKAQLGVTRATNRLSDAQDKLLGLQNSGTATARELSDAQDDVTQATYDLHDANANLITTQDTVNHLFQVGAENSPEVVAAAATVESAHQTLADATQHVADATQNVDDKQKALGTALAGDPNYDDKVRQARQNVADATQHVADAMYNVAQNKEKFEEAKKVLDESVGTGGPSAVDRVRNNIQDLLNKKPELALFFDPMLADLEKVAGSVGAVGGVLGALVPGTVTEGLLGGLKGLIPYLPGHAAGGPINGLSIVGEKGPELFAGRGTIIPNHMLGGGGVTVNINARVAANVDPDAVGQAIAVHTKRAVAQALDDVGRQAEIRAWRN